MLLAVVESKLVPAIETDVPEDPDNGLNELMAGTFCACNIPPLARNNIAHKNSFTERTEDLFRAFMPFFLSLLKDAGVLFD